MDFLHYLFTELHSGRLQKSQAMDLIKQFRGGTVPLTPSPGVGDENKTGTLLLERQWAPAGSQQPGAMSSHWPSPQRRYVLVEAAFEQHLAALQADKPVLGATLKVSGDTHAEQFVGYAQDALTWVQEILSSKPTGVVLLQIVLSRNSALAESAAALVGLLKCASRENSKFRGQLVQIAASESIPSWLAALENACAAADQETRYENGQRQVVTLRPLSTEAGAGPVSPWKKQGVYLITGGLGGLGLLFAEEIATRAGATIILTGRSPQRAKQQAQLAALRSHAAHVEYVSLDVADAAAVSRCVQQIQMHHGRLDGVIHSAGVIRDSFLIKKTSEELRDVLAPKVQGIVNLDAATAHLPLDFMAVFSSTSALFGNVGQADYATANAFMDRYAEYRNSLVQGGQRQGRTLSINWPLWAQGGMQIDTAHVQQMRDVLGLMPLTTQRGLEAFYRALRAGPAQVVVLEGEIQKLLLAAASANTSPANADEKRAALDVTGIDAELLKEKTLQRVKQVFSSVTKLAVAKLDEHEPLESYGIDSIMIMQLNQRLAEVFGELSKTLFYEYPTLAQLRDHLVAAHAPECAKWCGLENQSASPAVNQTPVNVDVTPPASRSTQWRVRAEAVAQEPIAVIGLSGRYPQSRDMQSYWEHLQSGQDCIVEIPPERWSLEGFYEADLEAAVSRGRSYSKWGGFLEGFAEFDPLFFNISPREAQNMDPQERLFLQASWSVLEDAGYTRELIAQRHQGRVGVFAGITKTGFDLYGPALWAQGQDVFPHTSFSSVANRVSYLLDLHGPSMPIDTMCSASLTAIHEACEHLLRDECEMALAGGVNLYLHPSSYVALCGQRMLSVDGRCRSFGAGGTGFVPGEGVGVVLLKRLSRAQADGDHIRAVIRASSVNHGGKTHGYTVPNPKAQGDVIRRTLQKAGIHPRAISYIEAHGTGTQLGDPIELSGLTQAFAEQTQDRQYCALGSVKSNIGHLEAAAGIAGVTKIVLQMEHQALAPSLHAQELNPNIDFERTPFVMQRTATPWQRPKITLDGEEREYPRIAGISSFGAGGSNAHVILEEYVEPSPVRVAMPPGGEVIIVLSAKSELQLQQQVQNLLEALQRGEYSDADLPNIAYTLQVGREAMEQRMATSVANLSELIQQLDAAAAGQWSEWTRGSVKRDESSLSFFAADQELQEAIGKWIERGKFSRLLDLWVQGLAFDWNQLYASGTPRRIRLPTYPFAKERYWMQVTEQPALRDSGARALHPLLQQNDSTAFEIRFSSKFSGGEFLFEHHRVQGTRVLPGVGHLEMARAALAKALDTECPLELSDVVWLRPVEMSPENSEARRTLQISVQASAETNAEYEIHGVDEHDEEVIYSQGVGRLLDATDPAPVNLAHVKEICHQRVLGREQIYAAFAAMGLQYGPGHQSIAELQVGVDDYERPHVLATLRLPDSLLDAAADFVLHPSVMDGALQAAMGLAFAAGGEGLGNDTPMLPFAAQSIAVHSRTPRQGYAWIRFSDGSGPADAVQRIEITVCDTEGCVCVQLNGLSTRRVNEAPAQQPHQTLLLEPRWELCSADAGATLEGTDRDICFIGELDEDQRSAVRAQWPAVQFIETSGAVVDVAANYERIAGELLERVQRRLRQKLVRPLLLQVIIAIRDAALAQCCEGLSGLLRTACQENPRLLTQCISMPPSLSAQWVRLIETEARKAADASEVRYTGTGREVRRFIELANSQVPTATSAWRDRGVYLITGGAGGLGLIVANAIAQSAQQVTLVLTGRSELSAQKQAQLNVLRELRARVDYQQVDVADRAAVQRLIASIESTHGRLTGILHCAGVIQDNFILNKTPAELHAVFAPKVAGLVNLDEATRGHALEQFICFSSMAGVLGNVGQADYAAANAFMDAYASYRNQLASQGSRHGRTVSINWPLWAEGGMQVDGAVKAQLRRIGLSPLSTLAGVTVLNQCLCTTQCHHFMVLAGDAGRIRSEVLRGAARDRISSASAVAESGHVEATLRDKAQRFLKQTLSRSIKLPVERIEVDAPFDRYGIDSVRVIELTRQLETHFGALSKTLFFEYQTIAALADYFMEQHAAVLKQLLGSAPSGTERPAAIPAEPVARRSRRTRRRIVHPEASSSRLEDIAIIGMSGRYPQADDLRAYWENLKSGRDCITEIPASRWDYREFFDAQHRGVGKSYSKWGGFIDGVDEFDPLFFNISPTEAQRIDPNERLFLQCVYETLEDAGYTAAPGTVKGRGRKQRGRLRRCDV